MIFGRKKQLNYLLNHFQNNSDIIAFSIFGSTSLAHNAVDFWSDIDGLLVIKDESFAQYSTNTNWISFVGNLFTYQHHGNEYSQTFRFVFDDFKKIDLVLVKESTVDEILKPNTGPYWKELTILFSTSVELEQKLKETKKELPIPHFNEKQFNELVQNFWFVAQLSLYKTIRNDLLIAQHLALDLYKDILLLGMIIRDREMGTTIHKTGGMGNDLVQQIDLPLTKITQLNLLDFIENCGKEFDQLCIQWNKDFKQKNTIFLPFLNKAREEINS